MLVITDLVITEKSAQFVRGVMVDVGNKWVGHSADDVVHEIRIGGTPDALDGSATDPGRKLPLRGRVNRRAAGESAPAGAASARSRDLRELDARRRRDPDRCRSTGPVATRPLGGVVAPTGCELPAPRPVLLVIGLVGCPRRRF